MIDKNKPGNRNKTMKNKACLTNNYDCRVARIANPIAAPVAGVGGEYIYCLCECHYDNSGTITSMSIIDDMTCYGRADALEFLTMLSAATTKPIIDNEGKICAPSLIDPGKVMLSIMTRGHNGDQTQ